jgi:4,5-DOPA dioxygenase extradiol
MKRAAPRLPVLFLGHGNPMRALRDDAFSRTLGALGRRLGKPRAILCVSAHWLTRGPGVTAAERPRTIHDFGGFPPELYAVEYPAPGSPALAARVRELVPEAEPDADRGLDHGAWSVLRHMYPGADVPVVQLGVAVRSPGSFHLELGRRLAPLREEGILVVGSGNVVHNLAEIDWDERAPGRPWAAEFDAFVKRTTEAGDAEALAGDPEGMPGGALSVPTPDHWYPYLTALGAADGDAPRWEYEGLEHASLSMRCASFGA